MSRKQKTADSSGKKKRFRRWQMVLIIIAVIIIVLVLVTVYNIAKSEGAFSAGNADEYSVENTESLEDSPLEGKTIIFLGSSVTYGSAAKGESFADYMAVRDGITAIKEALSGTTLVDETTYGKASYIERMKTIDTSIEADAFICQLSTNDATMKKELGEISDSYNMEDFDVLTVTGAMEYVIAYAQETWGCPVIFYTGTHYNSDAYQAMVDRLLELQEKWDIGVIDLWNDEDMNSVSDEDYALYMVNSIHPSRAGYREWWTPKFEAYLTEYLGL